MVFGSYARYYDLLNAGKDYRSEAAYVDRLLSEAGIPDRTVLDLGCGTGMHASMLADAGYAVTGVDRSETMLEAAARRASDRLRFVHGDARSVRIDRTFGAVVSLFHVISYHVTNDDLARAFTTARAHLGEGGLFVFDCWYGPAVLAQRPEVRTRRWEDDAMAVERIAEPLIHPNEDVVDVDFRVTIRDKATGGEEKLRELHRMRYLFLPETEAFLGAAGFDLVRAEEWLTGNPAGFETWSVCVIARARGS